jgi:hypothetical protein
MTTRRAQYPLKAWNDPNWQRPLSRTLTVSRVDEDIPTEDQTRQRKPWSVALTRAPGVVSPEVQSLPAGTTLLLSAPEVLALVAYLLEPQTAVWCEVPTPTAPGRYAVRLYFQPGMVAMVEDGSNAIADGEAHWTPDYFRRAEPTDTLTPKGHTLPWPMKTDSGETRRARPATKTTRVMKRRKGGSGR